MDATGLKALNLTRSPLHDRSTALARVLPFPSRRTWRSLPSRGNYLCRSRSFLHSAAPRSNISSAEGGDEASAAAGRAKTSKLLHVVLVSPQIAGNTGCIARTCAASAVGLHLVEPLGYKVDDTKLKRAGLDYWPMEREDCWLSQREEQKFTLMPLTGQVTGWFLDQRPLDSQQKFFSIATARTWEAERSVYQWLRPMSAALISPLVWELLCMKHQDS